MSQTYETISGHRIEYPDPDPALDQFLSRVQKVADDPGAIEDDLVALIYGRENPILDHTVFLTRGAVTKEVLANPVYHVLTDLLARKHLAQEGISAEQLARAYTDTVAQAAEALGITQDAVRRAIRERRLPSWVKDGAYYLDPSTYHLLGRVGQRGPVPGGIEPLECVAGYNHREKVFLRVKTDRTELPVADTANSESATIGHWRRAAVLTGGHGRLRMFLVEPANEDGEIAWHEFSVRGRFRIAQKFNGAQKAKEAWEGFGMAEQRGNTHLAQHPSFRSEGPIRQPASGPVYEFPTRCACGRTSTRKTTEEGVPICTCGAYHPEANQPEVK